MSLNDSFQRAEKINREQEKKLKSELQKEQIVINQMIQEIMWGSSVSSIKFDVVRDFGITYKDADLFYEQALKYIEKDIKWTQR